MRDEKKIPGIRIGITKYIAMTGQSEIQALPCFNILKNACNAARTKGKTLLTSTEQIISQDQTEYDNAKSEKSTV